MKQTKSKPRKEKLTKRIKKFLRKILNEKDVIDLNPKLNHDEKYLRKNDLKFY